MSWNNSVPRLPLFADHRLHEPWEDGEHCGARLQQACDWGGRALHPWCSVCHPLPGQEEVSQSFLKSKFHCLKKFLTNLKTYPSMLAHMAKLDCSRTPLDTVTGTIALWQRRFCTDASCRSVTNRGTVFRKARHYFRNWLLQQLWWRAFKQMYSFFENVFLVVIILFWS